MTKKEQIRDLLDRVEELETFVRDHVHDHTGAACMVGGYHGE